MLVLAGTGLAAASLICTLALASLLSRKVAFWPPEGPPEQAASKQKRFLWMFRAMFYPTLAATILHLWNSPPAINSGSLLAGLGVALGFGGAFFSTAWLGWRVAFGEADGDKAVTENSLVTSGPFALSRHPVYVSTWLGLVGWAALADVTLVRAALVLWALFYVIAIFLEEPWL